MRLSTVQKTLLIFLAGSAAMSVSLVGAATNIDPETRKCVDQELKQYIGKDATALDEIEFGQNVNVRIIRPNTMVTQDYLPDRTNIHIDQNEKITRIVCG